MVPTSGWKKNPVSRSGGHTGPPLQNPANRNIPVGADLCVRPLFMSNPIASEGRGAPPCHPPFPYSGGAVALMVTGAFWKVFTNRVVFAAMASNIFAPFSADAKVAAPPTPIASRLLPYSSIVGG